MPSPTFLDHGLRHLVQGNFALDAVLHTCLRDGEDRRFQLRNLDLPTPAQAADLMIPGSGVDLEQRHPARVFRQFREQQPLLLH